MHAAKPGTRMLPWAREHSCTPERPPGKPATCRSCTLITAQLPGSPRAHAVWVELALHVPSYRLKALQLCGHTETGTLQHLTRPGGCMRVEQGVSRGWEIPRGSMLLLGCLIPRPCSVLCRAAGRSFGAVRIFALPLGVAEVGPCLPVPVAAGQLPPHKHLHIPCHGRGTQGQLQAQGS